MKMFVHETGKVTDYGKRGTKISFFISNIIRLIRS
jgi:hypothetical protein